jgi:hypothetical protein
MLVMFSDGNLDMTFDSIRSIFMAWMPWGLLVQGSAARAAPPSLALQDISPVSRDKMTLIFSTSFFATHSMGLCISSACVASRERCLN